MSQHCGLFIYKQKHETHDSTGGTPRYTSDSDLSQSEGDRVLEGLCWVSVVFETERVPSLNIQEVASALIVVQLSFILLQKADVEYKQINVDRSKR